MKALFLILFILTSCNPITDSDGSLVGIGFEDDKGDIEQAPLPPATVGFSVQIEAVIEEIRNSEERDDDLINEFNSLNSQHIESQIGVDEMEYEIVTRVYYGTTIFKPSTGQWIPLDEGNRHYREYLEWIEEGNDPNRTYAL